MNAELFNERHARRPLSFYTTAAAAMCNVATARRRRPRRQKTAVYTDRSGCRRRRRDRRWTPTDRPASQRAYVVRSGSFIMHTHTHTPVRTIYIYSQHASGGRDRRPRASPPPFVRHNTRHVITSPPGYPCTWCGTTTNRYLSHGGVTINLGPPAKTWSSGPTPSNQTSWKFYVQSNQMLTGSHVMLTTNQPTRCEKKFWGGMD